MYVEKCWDEVWVEVKFQTNLEIAGSLRNSFRASLGVKDRGGRALFGLGARLGLLNYVLSGKGCGIAQTTRMLA